MKLKHIIIGGLVVATGVGFWYAKTKIDENGGGGSGGGTGDDAPTPVQYAEVTATGATLYDSGAVVHNQMATDKSAAIAAVHAWMEERGVVSYFIFTQVDDGTWWATGYTDGNSASDDMGPFADQTIAMQAGTKWVQARPVPGAAVGARASSRHPGHGGGMTSRGPSRGGTVEHGSDALLNACPPGHVRLADGRCVAQQHTRGRSRRSL